MAAQNHNSPMALAGCPCHTGKGGKALEVDPELKEANRNRLRRI